METTVTMETVLKWLSILAFWLGMFARVVLPYLEAYWKSGGELNFDWDYVKGQLVGSLVTFLGLLMADGVGLLEQLGALGVILAFLTGYFGSHTGRQAQKFGGAMRTYQRHQGSK